MHIRELIAFVTCPLNYIAVVTRVNVARTHTQTYTRDSISRIVTPSCPICVQRNIEFRSRVYLSLLAITANAVRLSLPPLPLCLSSLRVIERDFARRGKIFDIRDDGATHITRSVTRHSDI